MYSTIWLSDSHRLTDVQEEEAVTEAWWLLVEDVSGKKEPSYMPAED